MWVIVRITRPRGELVQDISEIKVFGPYGSEEQAMEAEPEWSDDWPCYDYSVQRVRKKSPHKAAVKDRRSYQDP